MALWRPRCIAQLTVPFLGTRQERINQAKSTQSFQLTVRPTKVRLESNDHNEADRCDVTADWTECGVDPRMLDDAVVAVYLDTADDRGVWKPSACNLRFIGLAKDIDAERTVDDPATVKLSCVDYTTLFLTAKPFGSSGIPDYSQTLDEAWNRIVSQTPGAEIFTDALVLEGLDTFPVLGKAVAERFRNKTKVPTKPDTDAWAVWQQCVGMLGLISYIRQDKCVVTTATNFYTEQDPPVLTWGVNIDSWSESRHSDLAGKGVGLTSFDPLTGTTIEAFYPPIGDVRVKKKKAGAKKAKGGEAAMRQREDRDYFAFPGVTNPDVLAQCAQRVWEERSRQEIEGKVSTGEMYVKTRSGATFDMIKLAAGNSVSVRIDPKQRQLLSALPTEGAQIRYLTNRGYTERVAKLIVANAKEFAALSTTYFTRNVTTELSFDADGGDFNVDVSYVNRIEIEGT